jgi:PAT family beta-lactamase induction signal transducer AmpG
VSRLRVLFSDRTLLVLLLAGFSSGVPLFLVGKCLQAWFTQSGVDLKTISYASLIGLPWSLKFLWAPFTDRLAPPGGRRRGWLMLSVLGLILATAAMSQHHPPAGLQLLVVNAVLIALFSATQDVVVDAYRVESLSGERQGSGAAAGVLGYRAALLVTGGLGFILAGKLSWPTVYLLMAGVQGVGLIAWLLLREPPTAPPQSFRSAVIDPLREYTSRRGLRGAVLVAGFAVLYKLGDSLAGVLSTPFLLSDGGFSTEQIGVVQNTYGLGATLVGVVLGGLAMPALGLNRSLWIFGIGQAASNLAYAALAHWGGGVPALMAVMTVENLCAGLGTASFVAFLSAECAPAFAATQYALLSSLMAAGRDVLSASAGADKQWYNLGWTGFFLATVVAAVPGLLLLPAVAPWRSPTRTSTDPISDRTT